MLRSLDGESPVTAPHGTSGVLVLAALLGWALLSSAFFGRDAVGGSRTNNTFTVSTSTSSETQTTVELCIPSTAALP